MTELRSRRAEGPPLRIGCGILLALTACSEVQRASPTAECSVINQVSNECAFLISEGDDQASSIQEKE
jgi:hypothetical protein